MDITDIGHKVENGGVSAQGKLSAEEFNTILDKVVELWEGYFYSNKDAIKAWLKR